LQRRRTGIFRASVNDWLQQEEAAYVAWRDLDLTAGVVRVTAKPEYNFRPKDFEEREVPIPDRLIVSLKRWAKSRNGSELIFPTRNGTPRKHRKQLLDLCKAIAKRAKLDPEDFWLHKLQGHVRHAAPSGRR
jgi:integrase